MQLFPFADLFFLVEWSNDEGHSVVSAKQLAGSENQILRLTRGDPVDVTIDRVKHKAVILDSGKL